MYTIGLTGSIACGKSTVLSYLASKGIPFIDADLVAREVVEPGEPALQSLVDVFGESILQEDGALNRSTLGDMVFHDAKKRKALDDIMGKYIRHRIVTYKDRYEVKGTPVIIMDIPLLIEKNYMPLVDAVWVVAVSEDTQLQRLMARNGYTREQALQRIQSQMPVQEKLSYADVVIHNDGTLDALHQELDRIYETEKSKWERT